MSYGYMNGDNDNDNMVIVMIVMILMNTISYNNSDLFSSN